VFFYMENVKHVSFAIQKHMCFEYLLCIVVFIYIRFNLGFNVLADQNICSLSWIWRPSWIFTIGNFIYTTNLLAMFLQKHLKVKYFFYLLRRTRSIFTTLGNGLFKRVAVLNHNILEFITKSIKIHINAY
jgi:hypothetical protein